MSSIHIDPSFSFIGSTSLPLISKMSVQELVRIDYEGQFAIITLNNPKKFNSLTQSAYYRLASLLREADANNDVYVTLLIGEGPFFSA